MCVCVCVCVEVWGGGGDFSVLYGFNPAEICIVFSPTSEFQKKGNCSSSYVSSTEVDLEDEDPMWLPFLCMELHACCILLLETSQNNSTQEMRLHLVHCFESETTTISTLQKASTDLPCQC